MFTYRAISTGIRAALMAGALIGAVSVWAQQTPTGPAPEPGPGGVVGGPGAPGGNGTPGAGRADSFSVQTYSERDLRVEQQAPGAKPAGPAAGEPAGRAVIQPVKAGGAPVGVKGGGQAFEPFLQRPVTYGPVPAGGLEITASHADTGAPAQTTPASVFLDDLAAATEWNILVTEEAAQKQLRYWVSKLSPAQALEVLRFHGLYYEFDPDSKFLYVMTVEEHLRGSHGAIEQAELQVKHADIVDVEAILGALSSEHGRIISDPRTNRLLVWDTRDNIAAMRDALARVDVPVEPRVFHLKHLDAVVLVDSLQTLLSERGVAYPDPRMNIVTVTDIPSRLDQIGALIETIDIPQASRTWTLNYVEPEDVEERLENLVPEEMGSISIDEKTHQITVIAIPERIEEIDKLIQEWDVPRKQVQIEAYLVLATKNVERELGINWSYFGDIENQPFALRSGTLSPDFSATPTEGQLFTAGTLPAPVLRRNPVSEPLADVEGNEIIERFRGNTLSVVLSYLDKTGDATILSRPRVTVQDGETATFRNTEEIPYQQGGFQQVIGTGNQGFNSLIPLNINFLEVGTVLEVKPRINEERKILMDIAIEDSTVARFVQGLAGPIPSKRQAKSETQVLVHSAETIVIGGLENSTLNKDAEKVPVLGDIPLLGRLFRSTKKDHTQRELLLFLTPIIVDEFTNPESQRLAGYDEEKFDTLRHNRKGIFGRTGDRVSRGLRELGVSIGQSGAMYSEGELVTLEKLAEKFANRQGATVVIRAHPLAPSSIGAEVADLAFEHGLRVEFEDKLLPFVPVAPAP